MSPLSINILAGKKDESLLRIIDEMEHLTNKSQGEIETLNIAYYRLEQLTNGSISHATKER